ncbi:MAG: alpha/beta hydrolase [Methylococcaceae bacterium]|nr:alpha/beta hydrolase [Methylococcaceae bacterium]
MAEPPKTPLLLIRGLMREQRHWGDFIRVLQLQFPLADIITLDLPGNGHLYESASPKTIADMTEALRQQLTPLQRASPLNLIALSMGGMIAIDWMARYPKEIATGVLINTSVGHYAPFYQRLRWQNYLIFLKMGWQSPAQREQAILGLTSNFERDNAELLKNWQCWQQQYPVSGENAFNQLLASALFNPIKKPLHPLLIITSTADHLVDYYCSVRLHQAWQTAFAQHDTAGHDLPLDDPLWVSQMIKNWLDSLISQVFYLGI